MKLSIITINYNNKAGLQKTIDSVICQTWKDYEWIIIDGGSTDGSKELIEQYQQYFAYWCSEPDKGVYNAMNKGITKAKGEYLNFMNSGDCFVCDSTLMDVFFKEISADIVAGPVLLSTGRRLYQYQENIVEMLVHGGLCHQSSFIKKILFDNYKYNEDYHLVSDWIAFVEWLIFERKSFQYIDVNIAIYNTNGMSSDREVVKKEKERYLREHLGLAGQELLQLYKERDHLKGEPQIPAIKMIRYLYYNAPKWFSVLYRVILIVVKIRDFVSRKKSYATFEKQLNQ